ncbi:non-ribosomal peptide synthetase [Allonocardiopsis opalescens]|uniref:Amino acid adenylation domain-containing protein n=1 Tax=Allonocardiopsis opalescens TaxID=1144618 RepID=A0A2T0PYJ4_9ACTN|nr:non-ribosomal peptide synthetase [Allonocardiopsis opalescens]PRX96529.1 amino acid adenylation domain-containing protein [Allonocardiopsis opalescens]
MRIPLERGPGDSSAPASSTQERFWFAERLRPGTAVHNLAFGARVDGALDAAAVREALREIVRRHSVLRTRLVLDGDRLLQVTSTVPDTPLAVREAGSAGQADALVRSFATEPFELSRGPLFRAALIRAPGEQERLVLVAHHAVFDGWSLGVFFTEFAALYRAATGQGPAAPPPALQYADYARWQRARAEAREPAGQYAFWERALAEEVEPLEPPLDHPRAPVPRFLGGHRAVTVDGPAARRLSALAAEESATLYMAVLAAFQVLLYRHTGRRRFHVGTPTANRPDERLHALIGPFVNVLPVRADLTGDPSFRELLVRTARTVTDVLDHQEVPLQALAGRPARPGGPAAPLFRTAVAFQNFPAVPLDLGAGTALLPFPVETGTAQDDLALFVSPGAAGLDAVLRYDADLLRADTVAELAADLSGLLRRLARDPELPISRLAAAGVPVPRRVDRAQPVPPTPPQRRLHAARAAGAAPERRIATAPLPADASAEAVGAALGWVEERYEALRTVLVDDGGPLRQVVGPPGRARLRRLDPLAAGTGAGGLAAALAAGAGPDEPLAVGLARSPGASLLIAAADPLALDAWSLRRVMDALVRGYHAAAAGGSPGDGADPPLQAADHAVWLRRAVGGADGRARAAYWRERLAGMPARLPLAGAQDGPGPGRWVTAAVAAPVPAPAGPAGAADDALLAGAAVALSRFGAGRDVVMATPAAGRTGGGQRAVVGALADVVPVRIAVREDESAAELIARVHAERTRDSAAELPFDTIAAGLDGPCEALRQVLVLGPGDGSAQDWEPDADALGTALVLAVGDGGAALRYRTDRYLAAAAEELAAVLAHLLECFAADPHRPVGEAESLPDERRLRILAAADATGAAGPDTTLLDQFERRAAEAPEADAVIDGATVLSYREVAARAARLAGRLTELGAVPGRPVAVLMDAGAAAIVALLGVVKAGAAFACVDPVNPGARVRGLIDELRPALVVADAAAAGRHAGALAGAAPVAVVDAGGGAEPSSVPGVPPRGAAAPRPVAAPVPRDLAYIAYTSGSTGRPKGIPHTHADLAEFVRWQADALGIGPGQRVGQLAALSFDVAYCEIFGALCSGAALCMRPAGGRADPGALARWLRERRVTVLQVIPRLFREVLRRLRSDGGGTALRTVAFVGEPLPADVVAAARAVLGAGVRMVNIYGPTEAVAATSFTVDAVPPDGAAVPIGRPIDGRAVLVLDDQGRLCPAGVTGELWIAGPYLSAGYLGDPDDTAARFAASVRARPRGRAYRTGDLARLRHDGELEFVGRTDNQVKLMGVRVELEEVERAAARFPGVRECAAAVQEAGQGQHLVLYVVADPAHDTAALRDFLAERLPRTMVPGVVVRPAALPRTPNGKLDRRALPPAGERTSARGSAPPRTGLERDLAELVGEVLGAAEVGRDDDFFQLGGNSLQAARLVNRIRERHGADVPLQDLFARPTVAGTAAEVERRLAEAGLDGRLAGIEERLAGLTDDEVEALLAEYEAPPDADESRAM